MDRGRKLSYLYTRGVKFDTLRAEQEASKSGVCSRQLIRVKGSRMRKIISEEAVEFHKTKTVYKEKIVLVITDENN